MKAVTAAQYQRLRTIGGEARTELQKVVDALASDIEPLGLQGYVHLTLEVDLLWSSNPEPDACVIVRKEFGRRSQ